MEDDLSFSENGRRLKFSADTKYFYWLIVDFKIKNNFQLNQSQPSLTCAWHSSAPACFSNFPQWGNIHPLVGVGHPQQIMSTPVGGYQYPRPAIYITDLIWCGFISVCLQWAVIISQGEQLLPGFLQR